MESNQNIIEKFWANLYNKFKQAHEKNSSNTDQDEVITRLDNLKIKLKEEGRKSRETNVIRSMRTDMSVVSQSKMYEGASNKSLRMSNYLIRISIVLFMLLFFYLAFLLIGIDFNLVLMKLQSMLLGKSLHFLFSRLGWCGGGLILLAVLCFDFDPETMGKMMAPSGASGTSSSNPFPRENLDLNVPAAEPTPAAPVDPDVYQPLLSDQIRRQELSDRLRINAIGKGYSLEVQDSIVEKQVEIERKIEQALLSDGYSRHKLLNKRNEIRGFIFYPQGTALSDKTYTKYLDDKPWDAPQPSLSAAYGSYL